MSDTFFSTVAQQLDSAPLAPELQAAGGDLAAFIDGDAYVGEVYSIGYDEALVLIHDYNRQQVGGIPALSFLIATRVVPGTVPDIRKEDSSVLLLRVLDRADLPNSQEALRVRVENAERVSGELDKTFDHRDVMDPTTNNLLGYAGVRCRVIGTFYSDKLAAEPSSQFQVVFGSDLSNYYPNRGLKVFKARGDVLRRIVNYRDPRLTNLEGRSRLVRVGEVRYASTNRPFQNISSVPVSLTPTDLLGQKTALFGMTRTGKSNSTKIILKSVFALRWESSPLRVGQVVFDPNGEYANENTQDEDNAQNPNAIKNVWACGPRELRDALKKDVVTYGLIHHPLDPSRKLMLLNFYEEQNLQIGKEVIDAALEGDGVKYVSNFRDVIFERPEEDDWGPKTRYARRVLCYRALLCKAGLKPPGSIKPRTTWKVGGRSRSLFSSDLLTAMQTSQGDKAAEYAMAATVIQKEAPTWNELGQALVGLRDFIVDRDSGYTAFEQQYVQKHDGPWADDDLKKILEMFGLIQMAHASWGVSRRSIRRMSTQTTPTISTRIWLREGS